MIRQTFFAVTAIAISALTAGGASAASSQENISTCKLALTDGAPSQFADATYRFKSIQGGALRKITFVMMTNDGRKSVVCNVRRGNIVAIDWPAI